ncbi:MAG TPA: hypothetical protein PLU10_13375 [Chitinophagaceae bacterium]|nr:hypothetical protein [Chitinophagaceae bacterium]
MKTSKFLRLNWRDFLNGVIVALILAAIQYVWPVYQSWLKSNTWSLDIDFMALIKSMVEVLFAYLLKNLLTPENKTLFQLLFNKNNMDPINYEEAIAAAENIDDLGALTELPEEYYGVWVARYNELGLPEPVPTIDAIRAGSVGTSGPKK